MNKIDPSIVIAKHKSMEAIKFKGEVVIEAKTELNFNLDKRVSNSSVGLNFRQLQQSGDAK